MAASYVSDPTVIHFIYKMMMDAAIRATPRGISPTNPHYYVVPFGAPNRSHSPIPWTAAISEPLIYVPADITIVGGATMVIYDQQITDYKQRRGMFGTLRDEIKHDTQDVDMVWWPRNIGITDTHAFTIESPAMLEFVERYVHIVREISDSFPKQVIPGLTAIRVDSQLIRMAGVCMVKVYITVHDEEIKFAELAIHDNASSQRMDEVGQPIYALQPMNMDPLYCTSLQGVLGSTTTFRHSKPAVPSLTSYFRQQIFLIRNLGTFVPPPEEKQMTVYRRVIYIIKILSSYLSSDNERNTATMKRILGVNITHNFIHTMAKQMMQIAHNIPFAKQLRNCQQQQKAAVAAAASASSSNNTVSNEELQSLMESCKEKLAQHASNSSANIPEEDLPQIIGEFTKQQLSHLTDEQLNDLFETILVYMETDEDVTRYIHQLRELYPLRTQEIQNMISSINESHQFVLRNIQSYKNASNEKQDGGRRCRRTHKGRKKRHATKYHVKSVRRSRPSSR